MELVERVERLVERSMELVERLVERVEERSTELVERVERLFQLGDHVIKIVEMQIKNAGVNGLR